MEKTEIAGAGFINTWLNKSFVCQRISTLLLRGYPPPQLEKRLKVVVDYSSPNVAKEMHVGHLRFVIDKLLTLYMNKDHVDTLRVFHYKRNSDFKNLSKKEIFIITLGSTACGTTFQNVILALVGL